jgi:hypothetical protein
MAFRWARAVVAGLPVFALGAALRSPQVLATLIAGADAAATGSTPSAEPVRRIRDLIAAADAAHRDPIIEAVRQVVAAGHAIDVGSWLDRLDLSLDRVALAFAGGFDPPRADAAGPPATLDDVATDGRLHERVLWYLSDDHARVRRQIGLTVPTSLP